MLLCSTDQQTNTPHATLAKHHPKLLHFPPLKHNYPQDLVPCVPAQSPDCQRCASYVLAANCRSPAKQLPFQNCSFASASYPDPHPTQPLCTSFCSLLSAPQPMVVEATGGGLTLHGYRWGDWDATIQLPKSSLRVMDLDGPFVCYRRRGTHVYRRGFSIATRLSLSHFDGGRGGLWAARAWRGEQRRQPQPRMHHSELYL